MVCHKMAGHFYWGKVMPARRRSCFGGRWRFWRPSTAAFLPVSTSKEDTDPRPDLADDDLLDIGKTTAISITSPKSDFIEAEVNTVATEMIARDAFYISGGHLAALDRAFIRKVEETSLQ